MERKSIFWISFISFVIFVGFYALSGTSCRTELCLFLSSLNDFLIPILTVLNIYAVYGVQSALSRRSDILSNHKRKIRYQNKKYKYNDLKIKLNPNSTIEESYSNLCENISGLLKLCEFLAESDSNAGEELENLLLKCGVDPRVLDKIPYYENPFQHRHFEANCIGVPNFSQRIELNLLELKVNMYSLLLAQKADNKDYLQKLEKACAELEEYHEQFTICD